MKNKSLGFTLIELLVVIAVIGVLAAGLFTILNPVAQMAKGRDAQRKNDLKQLQVALETYYNDHNAYPSTSGWSGVSVNGGSRARTGAGGYIPDLAPTYIDILPVDPKGATVDWSGYLYQSDGKNYKLLCHQNGPESFPSTGQAFFDPVRPNVAWMICSGEPACSSW